MKPHPIHVAFVAIWVVREKPLVSALGDLTTVLAAVEFINAEELPLGQSNSF